MAGMKTLEAKRRLLFGTWRERSISPIIRFPGLDGFDDVAKETADGWLKLRNPMGTFPSAAAASFRASEPMQ